jgi:ligand-binding sensor domain-containing protein/signal transduction histidine kinase
MNAKKLIVTLLGLSCAPGSSLAQTLSPHKVFGRYQQYVWTDQHGLPQNSVHAIVRTRDGYLWLGTVEGAVRFDGVRFTVFDSSNTAEIKSSEIVALLEDRSGALWLATNGGGLNRLADGRFTRFTTREGLSDDYVRCLLEDRAGNLWIGTLSGGLSLYRNGRFTSWTSKDGLPDDHVWALAEDRDGSLWIGTSGGLARFKDGRFTVYTRRDGLPNDIVLTVLRDRTDHLWVGTDGDGICRFLDGRFTAIGANEGLAHGRVRKVFEDREGTIWIGTDGGGLYRFRDGRLVVHTASGGLPGDRVESIYQDPDGGLWIGTNGSGLGLLKDGRFRVYTTQDGLAHDFVTATYQDAAGSVWVGTAGGGLSRFKDGAFSRYTKKDGLPSNSIGSIGGDRQGNVWVGSAGGVSRFGNGRFATWTTKEGLSNNHVNAVVGDRTGGLWIGTYDGGLNRFRDGLFTVYTTREGLAHNSVLSIYEDRAGGLWVGTLGGLSRFKDDRFTTWTTKDGLASNHVLSFYEDRAGSLWIGTHGGGLNRFKDGKFATVTTKDGLYDNLAFQVLEDDGGNLWMSGNRGIYRARLKELNDFAEGRIRTVTSFAYGVADGMLSRECNGAQPAGWKTQDGKLWFPTVAGVVVVDPQQRNSQPPLVAIEHVMLDRAALPIDQVVRIRPGQQNLEIQYTGLNWSRPAQVTFKYQMIGLDLDWVEAGTRRAAYYSHLPPGSYTFRVVADNGDGVWNADGKSLQVAVLPPFYRTWWFATLSLIAAATLVGLTWQVRVVRLQRAHAAQEAFSRQLIASQEHERKRLATELHDSLGQHLLIIKNRAALGERVTQDHRAAKDQFDEITASASQAISEVRAIVYNLRPVNLDKLGLTAVIDEMIEKVARASGIEFSTDIVPLDSVFPPDSEINVFRIIQESINNIVKHSQATKANVELWRVDGNLHIVVRDNGRGIGSAPTMDKTASPVPRGLGLTGIAERVRMLGGMHSITSTPGQGTTLAIQIPTPSSAGAGER